MILKTVGLGDALKDTLGVRRDVAAAFIYGSYARDTEDMTSDIDLFIIGSVSLRALQGAVSEIESRTKREINPTLYSSAELRRKCRQKNHFVLSVLRGPKLFLKGDDDGLRRLASGRKAP